MFSMPPLILANVFSLLVLGVTAISAPAQTKNIFHQVLSQFDSRMEKYGKKYDEDMRMSPPSAVRSKEDLYLEAKLGLDRTTFKHMVVIDPLFLHVEEFPFKLAFEYQGHYFPAYARQRTMSFYGSMLLGKMLFPEMTSPLDRESQIREEFVSGARSDPLFLGIQLYTEHKTTDLGVTPQWDLFHRENKSHLTKKLRENHPESFSEQLRHLNTGDPVGHFNFLTVFSEFHENGLSSEPYGAYTPFWLEAMDFRFGHSFAKALNQLAFSDMMEKLGFTDPSVVFGVVGSEVPFVLADGYANWMSLAITGKGFNVRRPRSANFLRPGSTASVVAAERTNVRKRKYFERSGHDIHGCRQRDLVLMELDRTQDKPYQYGDYENSALVAALRSDFHTSRYDETQSVFAWALVDFLIRGRFQDEPNLPVFRQLILDLRDFFDRSKRAYPNSADKKFVQELRAMYQLLRIVEMFAVPASRFPEFKDTEIAVDLSVLSDLKERMSKLEVGPEEMDSMLKDERIMGPVQRLSGYLAWVHKRWSVGTYSTEVNDEKLDSNHFRAFGAAMPPAPAKKKGG